MLRGHQRTKGGFRCACWATMVGLLGSPCSVGAHTLLPKNSRLGCILPKKNSKSNNQAIKHLIHFSTHPSSHRLLETSLWPLKARDKQTSEAGHGSAAHWPPRISKWTNVSHALLILYALVTTLSLKPVEVWNPGSGSLGPPTSGGRSPPSRRRRPRRGSRYLPDYSPAVPEATPDKHRIPRGAWKNCKQIRRSKHVSVNSAA